MTIAFFDFDGTLLRGDSGLLCAPAAARSGLVHPGPALRYVGARRLYSVGLVSRERAYAVAFEIYRGESLPFLRETFARFHREILAPRLAPAVLERVEEHRRAGDALVVLTLSAHFVAEPFGREARFDAVLGTRLEERDGLCTGAIDGPLFDGAAKLVAARAMAEERGVPLSACAFYSDHPADLPLLEAVGRPVVVGARRELVEIARARGWEHLPHVAAPIAEGAAA